MYGDRARAARCLAVTPRLRIWPSAVAVLACLSLAASGCGGTAKDLAVKGDCSSTPDVLAFTKLVPKQRIDQLLAPGTYRAAGTIHVEAGRLPPAYDGDCGLSGRDGASTNALSVGMVNAEDSRYAQAKSLLASGDFRGFRRIGRTSYVIPDSTGPNAFKAVAVLPRRFVVVSLLKPKHGVDGRAGATTALADVITRLR